MPLSWILVKQTLAKQRYKLLDKQIGDRQTDDIYQGHIYLSDKYPSFHPYLKIRCAIPFDKHLKYSVQR